jgi:hypothetical protein
VRKRSDYPNNTINGAKYNSWNLANIGIWQAHNKGPMPEPIDEFSKVILSCHFKTTPFFISGTFAIFPNSEEIEAIFCTEVYVIIKDFNS